MQNDFSNYNKNSIIINLKIDYNEWVLVIM